MFNIKWPRKGQGTAGGRPGIALLDRLLQPCTWKKDPAKKVMYCCVGCSKTFANQNKPRTMKHAKDCSKISQNLRDEVKNITAESAPSRAVLGEAALEAAGVKIPEVPKDAERDDKREAQREGRGKGDEPDEYVTAIEKLVAEATNLHRAERHQLLHLQIVRLFCSAGIPTSLVDKKAWIDFLHVADWTYTPASRSTFKDTHLVSEQENVLEIQKARLKTEWNLTLSCDGGTSKGHEAFYTVHISTASRKVYFVELRSATCDRHTGEWIKNVVLEIIDRVGRPRFAAVVSDSTGNTRSFRGLLTKEIPTLFNLPDIIHFISNTIKDIVQLSFFKQSIATIRVVIRKVHKVHGATWAFEEAQKSLHIGCGLESIGKTRFGTIILSAISVKRNLPALKLINEQGDVDFEDYADCFSTGPSRATANFKIELNQLVAVGTPLLKALTCLEANESNPADAFLFWHAAVGATCDVLRDRRNEFPLDVQLRIAGILEARHKQVFVDGNLASSAALYLAAVYVDPYYLVSDLFDTPDGTAARRGPKLEDGHFDMTGIRNPAVFCQITSFLCSTAANEILHGGQEVFTKWEGEAPAFMTALVNELGRYSRRQYPFNQPRSSSLTAVEWWRNVASDDYVQVLPSLAMKIYAVRVNSMPEECTASTLTWLTLSLRAKTSMHKAAAVTQIRQFYNTEEKSRKGSVTRPMIKFYKIKEKIFSAKESADEGPELDEKADSWLDEQPEEIFDPAESVQVNVSSLVSMTSTELSSLLADSQADKGKGQQHASTVEPRTGPQTARKKDNHFKLVFE